MIKNLEKDYETNEKFKNIIDKVPVIESIYKGIKTTDIPRIKEFKQIINEQHITEKIKFGNIIYDAEDFLAIDFDKIVENENFKLVGLSYYDEKLIRKLGLHNKNLIECLKIADKNNEIELFNTLLYSCLAIYLIIGNSDFTLQNISQTNLNILNNYKKIILDIINS